MQLESLRVFCDVARHRSFSRAAAANGVSQSAASQVVSQLEERLGLQLIDRSTRPLQVTDPGRRYYEGCERLLEQFRELEESIRQRPPRVEGAVQVAAIYSVGLGDMGQYVERFQAAYPEARVQLEYLHPDRVYERVLDGAADFGLVSFPRKSRELTTLPWREEEMVLACSPRHRLARNVFVAPGQLAGEKFVAFARGLTVRREVDRFLRGHDVAVETALEFDNVENIKQAVEVDAGIALLPEPTFRREVQAGSLVAVPLAGARFLRPVGIIQRRQHAPGPAAARFLELLRESASGGPPADRPDKPGGGPGRNGRHRKKAV